MVSPRVVRGAVGIIAFLVLLEIGTRAQIVDEAFLPPATSILAQSAELLTRSSFQTEVLRTLSAWAVGLAVTIAVAVPAGVLLGLSDRAFQATRAVVELMRPIPSVALIPLAILLYGQSLQMKVALVVYASTWPILFNTISGIHDVDPQAKETARVYGFGALAVLLKVSLRSAAPMIVTGIRIASSIALIIVISAELVGGGGGGIGAFMANANASGAQPVLVYGATVVAGVLGLVVNLGMLSAERRAFPWRPGERRGSA